MYAAKLRLELRAKRIGVAIEPTFLTGTSMSNDIRVDTALAALSRLRAKNTPLIDIS